MNRQLPAFRRSLGSMSRLGVCFLWTLAATWGAEPGIASSASQEIPPNMALIPAGLYQPPFRGPNDAKEVSVSDFFLDVCPVTNAEFLEFVRANPRWRRSQVKRLFADENYLKAWAADLDPGSNVLSNAAVTWVSWFSAKAYSEWKGKRLPTVTEWEFAAGASATRPDGNKDALFRKQISTWYATPAPERLPMAGVTATNLYGVRDLHAVIWEWVADFNTAMVTGDARGDSGLDRRLFCGSGAAGAKDTSDYPAFMRFGFRSSLKASYTVHNLGFRCAKDAKISHSPFNPGT
jgi:formylglycine-generating enzyme required for sulfatase activity